MSVAAVLILGKAPVKLRSSQYAHLFPHAWPSVLLLQLLQALGLINLNASILPTPPVVALVCGPSLAASREHVLALANLDLDLAQLGHDLLGL